MVLDTIISKHEINTLIKSLIRKFIEENKSKRNPASIDHVVFSRQTIPWTFSNRMTKAAGYAYRNGTMKFSSKIFAEMTKDEMYNTIAHETAHIIQRILYPNSKPHGYEWKSIMIDIGYQPKIYHNVVIKEQAQYTGTCKCRTHVLGKIRYNRTRKGSASYRCRVCKSTIKIKE